ncbi:hypothetical protein TpMuguga_03g00647 [Theileria parva strain Muguga]|uniref:Uncharacterized protein n=1 Tax=Theileria parva TaxID=5875 RepID=Q4MZ44_THEPA|nr:uncharacterized protein TpMuguga_03g00647 [Theileria parva strain Muguga]EAN30488.1 hypothetical protein TpMuguga_03g00647 [Theileria parva strain Muguga]|eukprot:XP_762771.1 hypothetical protein [Theileria parva strain Muguga]
MKEDEDLLYNSPSEMSDYLRIPTFNDNFKEISSESSKSIELPISNSGDVLSPEEGSITRCANIFDKLDVIDSDDNDFTSTVCDSHSESSISNSSTLINKYTQSNSYDYKYHDSDRESNISLTFSDRVLRERQRMIKKKIISEPYSTFYSSSSFRSSGRNKLKSINIYGTPKPKKFSLLTEEESKIKLDEEVLERYKRIDDILTIQRDDITDIKLSLVKSNNNAKNEALLAMQENEKLIAENENLLSKQEKLSSELEELKTENEQKLERIKSLQIKVEDLQSDLIVERKQNEHLLKDKVDLQNRLNLLTKENKSLVSSQEIMQNMYKNEIEELKVKKNELSGRISKLEADLDYFRDNLQESHKMNEILKSEIATMKELYKNESASLQKLKIENKRLMENNSVYKSQNYSLIEINDRLRNRTIFRSHSGEATTTNTSTATNANFTDTNSRLSFDSDSGLFSPNTGDTKNSPTNSVSTVTQPSSYLTKLAPKSHLNKDIEEGFPFYQLSETFNLNHSDPNSPNSLDSILTNHDTIISNPNSVDLILTPNGQDSIDRLASVNDVLVVNSQSNYTISDAITQVNLSDVNPNDSSTLRNETNFNPTTKWVTDRVSRTSSLEALENLREKIKNITTDSGIQNVNINSTFKCFQNNVTINLIQNKLQLISQRLNETIV